VNNILKSINSWIKDKLIGISTSSLIAGYVFFVGFALGGIWILWDRPEKVAENTVAVAPPAQISTPSEQSENTVALDLSHQRNQQQLNDIEPAADLSQADPDTVKIVLVIDDLGVVQKNTREVIAMQAPLTLSFLPYASKVADFANLAKQKGHELMIHLPMEPKGDSDPGPAALMRSQTEKQQAEVLNKNFSRFSGYVAVNNHMGSAYTEDAVAVGRLLDIIKEKQLMVLDSRTTQSSMLAKLAKSKNIPHATRDVFIDNTPNVAYIHNQLRKLENYAYKNGYAIGIGHPYNETIIALKQWLPGLKDKGISIIPFSEMVIAKTQHEKLLAQRTNLKSIQFSE